MSGDVALGVRVGEFTAEGATLKENTRKPSESVLNGKRLSIRNSKDEGFEK